MRCPNIYRKWVHSNEEYCVLVSLLYILAVMINVNNIRYCWLSFKLCALRMWLGLIWNFFFLADCCSKTNLILLQLCRLRIGLSRDVSKHTNSELDLEWDWFTWFTSGFFFQISYDPKWL